MKAGNNSGAANRSCVIYYCGIYIDLDRYQSQRIIYYTDYRFWTKLSSKTTLTSTTTSTTNNNKQSISTKKNKNTNKKRSYSTSG